MVTADIRSLLWRVFILLAFCKQNASLQQLCLRCYNPNLKGQGNAQICLMLRPGPKWATDAAAALACVAVAVSSFSQAHARKVKVLAPKQKCKDWANHQTKSVKESVEEDNLQIQILPRCYHHHQFVPVQ